MKFRLTFALPFLILPVTTFAYLPNRLPGATSITAKEFLTHRSRRLLVQEVLARRIVRTADKMEVYHSSAFTLTLRYPTSWTMQETLFGSLVSFVSPAENAADAVRENINVFVQEMHPNTPTLALYTLGTITELKVMNPDLTFLASEAVTIGTLAAHSVTYEQPSIVGRLKFRQTWTIAHGTAYLFTFTATPATFDQYEPIFQHMLDSFSVESAEL